MRKHTWKDSREIGFCLFPFKATRPNVCPPAVVCWSVASPFFGRALLLLPSATGALFFRCWDAPVLRSVSSTQTSTCSPQVESTKKLMSFCKVENTMALQKVVFLSFWALNAPPSNHRPASCVFTYVLLRFRKWCFQFFGHCTLRLLSFCKSNIPWRFREWCFHLFGHCALRRQTTGRPAAYLRMFLRPAAQDLAWQYRFDMKSMLPKTSAYVNKVATNIGLQTVFPTCCASLYTYLYETAHTYTIL